MFIKTLDISLNYKYRYDRNLVHCIEVYSKITDVLGLNMSYLCEPKKGKYSRFSLFSKDVQNIYPNKTEKIN